MGCSTQVQKQNSQEERRTANMVTDNWYETNVSNKDADIE